MTTAQPTSSAQVRPGLVMLVVGLGTLLSAAAASTVNLALPAIAREFSVSVDLAGWIMSAFLLAVTVLLLVAGRVGDLVGHRWVYLAGFGLVGVASLACGLAGGIGPLIAARVAQGIGGAMVMATGPALLTTSFPRQQRGRALGMLSTATYTGLTVGPPLGGWVVSAASWRWVFLINLPVAALVLGLGLAYLPRSEARASISFDWGGTATLVLGLPLLLFAAGQGSRLGWTSLPIAAPAGLGVLLLGVFVRIEARSTRPLLDLSLFRARVFTGAVLSALSNYVALFVPIVLLPFYLIEARHVPPSKAGLVLAAQPLVMAVVASPSGRLSDRIGSRGLATGGLLILAVGLGGLSTLGSSSSIAAVVGWLAVMGLGTGTFISPNSSALMGAAPRGQQGIAGGVMGVARNLGMIIGVAVGTSVFMAAGGKTGGVWWAADYGALSWALRVATGACVLGALAAALRGRAPRP